MRYLAAANKQLADEPPFLWMPDGYFDDLPPQAAGQWLGKFRRNEPRRRGEGRPVRVMSVDLYGVMENRRAPMPVGTGRAGHSCAS